MYVRYTIIRHWQTDALHYVQGESGDHSARVKTRLSRLQPFQSQPGENCRNVHAGKDLCPSVCVFLSMWDPKLGLSLRLQGLNILISLN